MEKIHRFAVEKKDTFQGQRGKISLFSEKKKLNNYCITILNQLSEQRGTEHTQEKDRVSKMKYMQTNYRKNEMKLIGKILKNRVIGILIAVGFSLSVLAQGRSYYECLDYFSDGNYAKAIECLTGYIKGNPKDVDALIIRAKCYGQIENYQLAFSDINEAIKYHSKKSISGKDGLYAQRGQFYEDIENYDEALNDYTTALKINPQNINVLFERANLYYNMDNYTASDADWNHILKIEKENVNAQIGLARNMIARGQTDEAIKELNRSEKIDSRNPYIYKYRGEAHAKKGDYRKAIDDLIDWCYYDDVDTKKEEILLEYAGHEFTYALAKVSEMIVIDKDDKLQWFQLRASLYEAREMYREAVEDYNTMETALSSPKIYIFYQRGFCYYQMDEYDKAIADFDEGLKLQEHKSLYLYKADAERLKGDYRAALADFTKVIELDPMNSWAYYRRGWTKVFDKDFQGALNDYTTSIELDREYVYTYFSRADLYRSYFNYPELAEKDYQSVLLLENKISRNGNCRQYALLHLGRKDDAIDHQKAILENYPNAGNYYDATCLYSHMNRQSDAIQYLRLAFEKGFRKFVHIENDTYLDNIRNTPEFIELIEEWKCKASEASFQTSRVVDSEPKQTQQYVLKTKELRSGVYEIPCTVNDLSLKFIFDTGASDITLSSLEAAFMLKNNYLSEYDFRDRQNFRTASGDIIEGTKVQLRKIKVGDLELDNVEASIVHNQNAPLLFGQSALGKFVKITIDNHNNEIIFEH